MVQKMKEMGLPNYMANPAAGAAHVDVLAKRTQGRWDRLKTDEQNWMNALSAGHGEYLLYSAADRMGVLAKNLRKPAPRTARPDSSEG
jgi:hypothetical protein